MLLTALASIIVLTCAACYVWSVSLGHVPAAFPYISETGSKDPESCLFGLGLNIAAFLYAIAVYLRYRELIVFRSMFPDCRISARVNRYSLWLGLVSAFGLAVVASFQVGRVKIPHFVGAALIFFGGNLYFAVQAFFSHRMCPAVSSRAMVRLRVVLTILAAVALTLTIVCGFFAVSDFTGDDDTQWYPDDGGYEMHVLSAAMEYATAAMFVASIVTYIPEMRIISISPPALRILLLESVIATKPTEKY